MTHPALVYNVMVSLLAGITPTLPGVASGTRKPAGDPEPIPDSVFFTRKLVPTDDVFMDHAHLNQFMDLAIGYHKLFGFTPVSVNSLENFLGQFTTVTTPIERVRLISHGSEGFMFCPLFTNGSWNDGLTVERLDAFRAGEDKGLRLLLSGTDTTLLNGVDHIITFLKTAAPTVLPPLGITATTGPTGLGKTYIEVVNDLFMSRHGTIVDEKKKVLVPEALLTDMVTHIEGILKTEIGSTISATALQNFRDEVLNNTDLPKTFAGNFTFAAGSLGAVDAATTANNESQIRNAINGDTSRVPLFGINHKNFIQSLVLLQPTLLNLAGTQIDTGTNLSFIAGPLEAYFNICGDLFFLRNGQIKLGSSPMGAGDIARVRAAVFAISEIIRNEVNAANSAVTITKLNNLRTRIENLTLRESTLVAKGHRKYTESQMLDLNAVMISIRAGFTAKVNHFQSLIQAGNKSFIDIRGCLVGAMPGLLDALSLFLARPGTPVRKPMVSGPEWFSVFTQGFTQVFFRSDFTDMDKLATSGVAGVVFPSGVSQSFSDWGKMIDFTPHFTFISGLFGTGATSIFDFASLQWRKWDTGSGGIPILRIEAARVDDLTSLSLGDIIGRFSKIFVIKAADIPKDPARKMLSDLQPAIAAFKIIRDKLQANPSPPAVDLKTFADGLNDVIKIIKPVKKIPTPVPSPPASNSLGDVQSAVASLQTYLDGILNTDLPKFFTAVQTRLGELNPELRYYLNIGLPAVFQHDGDRMPMFLVMMAAPVNSTDAFKIFSAGLRSFMRSQWQGTPAQATAMNAVINKIKIASQTEANKINFMALVTDDDPGDNPGTLADVAPKPGFKVRIKNSTP